MKANDVTRKLRKKNYKTTFDKCMFAIESVHEHCKYEFTTFVVPDKIPGEPYYDMDECIIFLKEELRKSDFYVRIMKPGNVLYISWRTEDVDKVKRYNEKMRDEEEKERHEKRAKTDALEEAFLSYDPDSALSNMHLTAELMKNNPEYSHLPAVRKSHLG